MSSESMMKEIAKQFASSLRDPAPQITPLVHGTREKRERSMIWGSIVGTLVLFLLVAALSGTLLQLLNLPSLLLVFGGIIGATLVNHSAQDLLSTLSVLQSLGTQATEPPLQRIQTFCMLSSDIRKEGLLILERFNTGISDSFLKRALDLVVDRHPQEEIRRILDQDLSLKSQKLRLAVQVLQNMALYAPNMGLIGTLLGLVSLLSSANNSTAIGPALAVALITTLYGAVLANIIFSPLAGRLSRQLSEQSTLHRLTIEGALCLARQDSAVYVEQRLKGFLSV